MKILNMYKNGNYNVMICDDGTKMRFNNQDSFNPAFPESIDLKITNKCPYSCPYCHEASTPDGNRAELVVMNNGDPILSGDELHDDILKNLTIKDCKLAHPFFDTLVPGTELAIGGGAVTTHPQLEIFLKHLKNKKIIANMTVNERELIENGDKIIDYMKNRLIHGLGISYVSNIDHTRLQSFLQKCDAYKCNNVVIHLIAGVANEAVFNELAYNNNKILILGYKDFRKGSEFMSEKVVYNINMLKNNLKHYIDTGAFETISFDNLAIKQLDVSSAMSSDTFKTMYMGDDGQFTMYIDLPNNQYAYSSIAPISSRHNITSNIIDMFNQVRNDVAER